MRAFQLALTISVPLLLSGCVEKPEASPPTAGAGVGTSQSGLTTASGYSTADVQVAYDRAERIKMLLGPDAPQALVQAQIGLGNILSGITPASASAVEAAIAAMLAAQGQAYDVAVSRGLASPGVTDPGGWDATWWDISSP